MANISEADANRAVQLFYFLDKLPGPVKMAVLTTTGLGEAAALVHMGVPIIYSIGVVTVLNAAGGVVGCIVSLNKR